MIEFIFFIIGVMLGGLYIRHLTEHLHQLWQVIELGKACLGSVIRAFGVEFVNILFVDFQN